jgi:hypothetical protein
MYKITPSESLLDLQEKLQEIKQARWEGLMTTAGYKREMGRIMRDHFESSIFGKTATTEEIL